jgi:hypothetical protein
MAMEMEDFLRKVYREELARVPKLHTQQTSLCPSIIQIAQYAQQGWPEELKEHARSCQYCQKSVANAWNAFKIHPTEIELNQENNVNRIAVERHINWDHCEACANKRHC